MSRRAGWEVRVFALVVLLLPRSVRRSFGADIVALFAERLAGVPRRGGSRVRLLVAAIVDALRHAIAMRAHVADAGVRNGPAELLGSVVRDARFGLRAMTRRPLVGALCVSTLALGVGGSTAIFSVVDGVLVKDLPYRDPDALVSIWRAWPSWRGDEVLDYVWDHIQFELATTVVLRERASSFAILAAVRHDRRAWVGEGRTDELPVAFATADLFGMLGVAPELGRTFTPDETLGGSHAGALRAVLSHELWTGRLGGDPGVLGRSIVLGATAYEVVGVLPEGFRLPSDLVTINDNGGTPDDGRRDVWLPLGEDEARCGNCLELLGRLAPGVDPVAAMAEVQTFLGGEGPRDQLARVERRKAFVTRGYATPLLVLLAAAAVLQVIACLNVAGIMVAESRRRVHEVSVRASLGAGRGRLARQLLTESAVVGVLGAGVGALLAWGGTQGLLAVAPPLPRIEEISVSARVLGFATASGLVTSLLFGLAPVAFLVGAPADALRARSWSGGPRLRVTHRAVTSAQVALTAALLIGAGLFGRSVARLMAVDPGFRPSGLATVTVDRPTARRSDADGGRAFAEELTDALAAVPGVERVSGANELPFPGGRFSNHFTIETASGEVGAPLWNRSVLPGYFEVMGIPLLEGRLLGEADGAHAEPVAVVSRSLAERYWPGASPMGRRLWQNRRAERGWTVVGVVGDVRQKSLAGEPQPTLYRTLDQRPSWPVRLVVRTGGDPAAELHALRREIWALDPSIPITGAGAMDDLVRASEGDDRFRATLMWTFAALAMVLAGAGVYGVTAQAVAARTQELGIRAALGASRGALLALVAHEAAWCVGVGLVAGIGLAASAAPAIEPLLFGVGGRDAATYAAMAALIACVGVVSCWLPARRATTVDAREVISTP